LPESNKYEMLLNDLNSIETQAAVLANKCKDLMAHNIELEDFAARAKKEITALSQKIVNLELDLEKANTEEEGKLFNLLNTKETETLKIKLQNLISRIDYHLTADRQV